MNSQEQDMFASMDNGLPRVIELHVKGIVPSFKTQKTAYGWRDKESGKIFARPATLPEHKKWMSETVQGFVSRLLSDFQITESTTLMDARLRSLIASLPRDDSWTVVPEIVLRGELCEPGQEGATIKITKISPSE